MAELEHEGGEVVGLGGELAELLWVVVFETRQGLHEADELVELVCKMRGSGIDDFDVTEVERE